MDRPRIDVDFNEMVEDDVVLLSKTDVKKDSAGNLITFAEGMRVYLCSQDGDDDGGVDWLLAEGIVELNRWANNWAKNVKWCCRIDLSVGYRHLSDG